MPILFHMASPEYMDDIIILIMTQINDALIFILELNVIYEPIMHCHMT
jgi:hypothetical protein